MFNVLIFLIGFLGVTFFRLSTYCLYFVCPRTRLATLNLATRNLEPLNPATRNLQP